MAAPSPSGLTRQPARGRAQAQAQAPAPVCNPSPPWRWLPAAAARAAGLLAVLVLTACAHRAGPEAPTAVVAPAPVLADALFGPPPALPRADQALVATPAMRDYLHSRLRNRLSPLQDPQQALLDALYKRSELQLTYDASVTRDAAQAFAERRGNCLSLVLMTAAFAREMGLQVQFNEALVRDDWREEGDLLLRSGHVNLTLLSPGQSGLQGHRPPSSMVVDFLPGQDLTRLQTRPVTEARVLAMLFNNRAAEALAAGDVRRAYWLAREALAQDPAFDVARNTLGVVYLRSGQPALAVAALEQVLARLPGDVSALTNLAQLHDAQGRPALAATLRARLPTPLQAPLHLLRLQQAQMLVQKGRPREAERALEQALAASPGPAEQVRYAGKLAWLRAQGQPEPH